MACARHLTMGLDESHSPSFSASHSHAFCGKFEWSFKFFTFSFS